MSLLPDPALPFWLLVAIGVLMLAPLCFAASRSVLSRWAVGIYTLATVTLFWAAGWSWVLRDGLGPVAAPSHGLKALTRASEQFGPAALVVGAEVGIAAACYRLRGRYLAKSTELRDVSNRAPLR